MTVFCLVLKPGIWKASLDVKANLGTRSISIVSIIDHLRQSVLGHDMLFSKKARSFNRFTSKSKLFRIKFFLSPNFCELITEPGVQSLVCEKCLCIFSADILGMCTVFSRTKRVEGGGLTVLACFPMEFFVIWFDKTRYFSLNYPLRISLYASEYEQICI